MERVLIAIDSINEWVGKQLRWFMLAAIFMMALEVTQRYVFSHPTMWGYESVIWIGASMYVLSWGFVHKNKGHVRVDVFYNRFPEKARLFIDILCFLIFYVPIIIVLLYLTGRWLIFAWTHNEKSVLTYLYWPIAPLRTAIFIGVVLFALQGIVQFLRDIASLVRREAHD